MDLYAQFFLWFGPFLGINQQLADDNWAWKGKDAKRFVFE